MKLASITPFIAISVLGVAVFTGHPVQDQKVDLTSWKSNQQILLFIENCQDGRLSISACREQVPAVLVQCRAAHVLACDVERLAELKSPDHFGVGTE